jgi:hypothetical protein
VLGVRYGVYCVCGVWFVWCAISSSSVAAVTAIGEHIIFSLCVSSVALHTVFQSSTDIRDIYTHQKGFQIIGAASSAVLRAMGKRDNAGRFWRVHCDSISSLRVLRRGIEYEPTRVVMSGLLLSRGIPQHEPFFSG